ncbi:hypothetical protein AAC387_Pa10g1610 [Persea americana]
MTLTEHRRRRNLLFVVVFVITSVIPISGDQPTVPSPITAEIKCGSCPCGNPCGQQPPPPPPPSPPPPSPPPPPTIPGIRYCPPPPPSRPYFYFSGPPGYVYTVDPNYFPSGANRNLEKLMKVLVSFGLLWLWELWRL